MILNRRRNKERMVITAVSHFCFIQAEMTYSLTALALMELNIGNCPVLVIHLELTLLYNRVVDELLLLALKGCLQLKLESEGNLKYNLQTN